MKVSIVTAACALLMLSACSKEEDTSKQPSANETSERDAAPGNLSETEPPSTPPSNQE